jgi:hypothetical protein
MVVFGMATIVARGIYPKVIQGIGHQNSNGIEDGMRKMPINFVP